LLVNLKQYEKALDICIQHHVPIQEELVKKMLPDEEPTNAMDKSKRTDLTRTIAEKCRKQGSFELASNLYVKLADKIKALKCLIELGDSQKVILFANNARNAETWILAANFLQTADWHQNPDLMKNIILFYSKAKAYDNLSSFFEACANVEIDEYRDYDKAIAALKEAIKHISKSTSPDR
jgi:intraflagellar transport protein 140